MGRVYLVETQRGLGRNRWCALKVLHAHFSKKRVHVDMFIREATLGAEVNHPHIARVFELGADADQLYMTQELLLGRTLKQVFSAVRVLGRGEDHHLLIARIFADLCDGLQALHEATNLEGEALNCVHRDVSPDNLFLTFEGFVKLLDLGLAKVPGRSEQTEEGVLKGKLSYLAPELLDAGRPSPASDVWSLGVSLWELLVGRRLFDAATDTLVYKALTQHTIVAPSTLCSDIPEALDRIVLRALERDPERRYPSAEAMGLDLEQFLRGEPCVSRKQLQRRLREWFPGEEERLLRLLRRCENEREIAQEASAMSEKSAPAFPSNSAVARSKERADSGPFWARWLPSLQRRSA